MGNRQQSRFLALVSSYDRYAELSEKAANAAGAGEEQFEKTLQGIEARTQQLQTSLQNLYTGAGLEKIYEQLLGIGAGILDYYNNISSTVGSGITGAVAAIGAFAGQFVNLATIVTNIFKVIKQNAKIEEQLFTNEYEAMVQQRVNERVKAEGLADSQIMQARIETEEKITAKKIADIRKIAKERNKAYHGLSKQQIGGLITSGISTAALGIASSDLVRNNQAAQGGLTALSGALSGLGTGLMMGGPAGAIIGALTALPSVIPGIIQLIKGLSGETDNYTNALERNKKAQEEYQKAQQKSQQQQKIVSSLESELEKLNKLEDSRYDSAESYEAYRSAMDELVEAYPGLIQYYDEEGRAIAIAREEREKYLEQQKELAKAAKREELSKQFNIDQDIVALENQGFVESVLGDWNDKDTKEIYQTILRDIRKTGNASSERDLTAADWALGLTYGADSNYINRQYVAAARRLHREGYGYTTEADLAEVFGYKRTDSFSSETDIAKAMRAAGIDITENADEDVIRDVLIKESTKAIDAAQKNNQDVVAAYDIFMRKIFGTAYMADNSVMRSILTGINTQYNRQEWEGSNEQTRKQIIRDWEQNEGLYSTAMEKNAFTELTYQAFEEYLNNLKQDANNYNEQAIGNYWQDFYETWKPDFSQYYNGAKAPVIESINEIYKNIDQYTEEQINNYIEQFNLDTTQGAGKDLQDTWKQRQQEIINNFNTYGKDIFTEEEIKDFSNRYSLALLQGMADSVPIIRRVAEDSIESFKTDWTNIFDAISQISDEKTRNKVIQLIKDKGIDSISGIFAIIDDLPDFEGKENLGSLLQQLTSYIVPNFIIEFDSMTDTLTSNFENLTKAISNAQKGMDLSDVINMADELGIGIDKFNKVGNKYYYTDYMALANNYLASQEEIAKYLFGQFDINTDNEKELEAYYRAVAAREQYYQSAREAYLAEGRLAEFLSSFVGEEKITITESELRTSLAQGEVPTQLQAYAEGLINWYNSLGDDVYKAFMDSLSNGEATTIMVTANNQKLLGSLAEKGLIKNLGDIGSTAIINFANATIEEIQAFYDIIEEDGGISDKEKNSYLNSLDDELVSRNKSVLVEIANSYTSFNRELAEKYRKAIGASSIEELGFNFDDTTRTYSIYITELQNLFEQAVKNGADAKTLAELQDAIQTAYKEIGNLIVSGLEGNLSRADAQNLLTQTEALGIKLNFTETVNGLRISRDSAEQLYVELLKIDKTAANIVFKQLKEELTQAGEVCEDMLHTMASIAQAERKIAKNTGETNKELEDRVKLYKQIAYEQMFDSSNYDFMGKSLPSGMQSPFTYWDNLASMRSTISEAVENQYVGYQDYWNMLNYMHTLAEQTNQTFTLFGQEITSDWSTVSAAWELGTKNFVANGDKTVIGLEGFGLDFEAGADAMVGNIDSGIDAFAQSQIDMLDALINFLDSIIAMEDLEGELSKLSGDSSIFDFSDLFKENGEFADGATASLEKYREQLNQIKMVLESGKIVGFGDWLIAGDFDKTEESLQSIYAFMQRIFELSKNNQLTPENIYAELGNLEGLPGIQMKFVDANGEEIDLSGGELEPKQQEILVKLTAETSEGFDQSIGFLTELFNTGEFDSQSGTIDFGDNKVVNFSTTIDSEGKVHLNLGGEDFTFDPKNGAISFSDWLQAAFSYYQKNLTADLQQAGEQVSNTKAEPVNIQNDNSNINISITYTNEQQTGGFVKIGDKKVDFGPNGAIPTAGAALQKAAYDYDQEYGGGTLQDISLSGKDVEVTSVNGVVYTFTLAHDASGNITDIETEWSEVETDIKDIIDAIDNPTLTGSTFSIKGSAATGYTVSLDISDISGIKIITYAFKIEHTENAKLSKEAIQTQWKDAQSDIAELKDSIDNLPDNATITRNGDGTYTVDLKGINIGGNATLTYSFNLQSQDLTNKEVWDSKLEEVRTAKEIYGSDLANLATDLGITNFKLTETGKQSGTLSVLMSLDGTTVVDCTYDVQWGNTNADEASEKIQTFRTRIEELKAERKQFEDAYGSETTENTTVANTPIVLFPDPIQYDASQKIELIDEGYKVYDSSGSLIGSGRFNNATEAVQAMLSKEAGNLDNEKVTPKITIARRQGKGNLKNTIASTTINKTLIPSENSLTIKEAEWVAQHTGEEKAYQQAREDIDKLNKMMSEDVNLSKAVDQYFKRVVDETVESGAKVFETAADFKQDVFDELGVEISDEAADLLLRLIMQPLEEFSYENYDLDDTEFKQILNEKRTSLIKSLIPDTAGEVYKTGTPTSSTSGTPKLGGMADREGLLNLPSDSDIEDTNGYLAIISANIKKEQLEKIGKTDSSAIEPLPEGKKEQQETTQQNQGIIDAITNINESLSGRFDNLVSVVTSVLNTILAEMPQAGSWYNTFDGISVHGDFWGEGNQLVLPDGNGGNMHLNLKDYVTEFANSLKEIQSMAANTTATVDVEANTAFAISRVNDLINNINSRTARVKVTAAIEDNTTGEGTKAKGDAALAKGTRTLMGELGPELWVSGGRYYVAGQNGAEFVNLPDDAIVFNHLQTQRLLGSGSTGRGKPVTNERRAVSYAKGNMNGGPAMASAKEVRAQLVAIRDIWTSLLNKNFSDLVETAGAGGGGGGGSEEVKKYLYDLDRWYNLLRQISKVEEQITYQQKLRANMKNGGEYVRSLEYELALLEKERSNYQMLSDLQKSYYDARRRDQEQSIYSYFFTYDDEGLMQYNDEAFKMVADLNRTDTTGQAINTSQEQIDTIVAALEQAGYSKSLIETTLYYNESGEQLKDAADIIQNFYDKYDSWIDEMDSIYDSYNEYQTKVQELISEQNEILEEYRDLQLNIEQQLLEAIENREQAIIDKLQDETDALRDASDKYINGLTDALNKERELYQQNEEDKELLQLQRRLAILQRSGGSASSIQSLQDQINSKMQDKYFETQQSEIDAIKEASDKQLEMMQSQIDLMTETLEYQKENGLFWGEVTKWMTQSTPEEVARFIKDNDAEYLAQSNAARAKSLEETVFELEKWYEHMNSNEIFSKFYDAITNQELERYGIDTSNKDIVSRARATAHAAYQKAYNDAISRGADILTARQEAQAAALAALQSDASLHPVAAPTVEGGADITTSTNTKSTKNYNNNQKAMTDSEKIANLQAMWDTSKKGAEAGINTVAISKVTEQIKTSTIETTLSGLKVDSSNLNDILKKAHITKYSGGGMNDYTGLAMLHGTPTRPEAVLNSEQTHILKNDILGKSNNSLLSLLVDFREALDGIVGSSEYNSIDRGESLVIENASVNMNVASIANDYDAKRAGETALEEMLRIARKTGAQAIRR